jgi:hypothetical protein
MRLDTWCPATELQVGDLVISADNRSARRILRFGTAFNPRFRPTVFEDDPHVAADLDRQAEVKIAARGTYAVTPNGIVYRLLAARLLPEQDSKRRSRKAASRMTTETIEVTVTRRVQRCNTIPPEQDVVIVRGPGINETLGSWSMMCVPNGPNGEPRTGQATRVPDDVVLEALFGDQGIYDMTPGPAVEVEQVDASERRYRVTVTRS